MEPEKFGDTPAPEAASTRAAYEPPMLVRVNVSATANDVGLGPDLATGAS